MEPSENILTSNAFMLAALGMVFIAIGVSYVRYDRNLDFLVAIHLPCDPAQQVCITESEPEGDPTYYTKFLVSAAALVSACPGTEDPACVHRLRDAGGDVRELACPGALGEGERCTSPFEHLEGALSDTLGAAGSAFTAWYMAPRAMRVTLPPGSSGLALSMVPMDMMRVAVSPFV